MGGSSRTEKTEIPAYMEEAGQFALEKAKQIDALGKLPYMGPEVAAVNPYEAALARNVGGMASAFGLEAPAALDMGGMPTVTEGGLTGYSSYPAYMASMERLRETRPDQYEYFAQMTGFDPITGAATAPPAPTPAPVAAPVAASVSGGGRDDGPTRLDEIMAQHDAMRAAREARRVTLSDGTTGLTPRPILRPDSRTGLSGLEQTVRQKAGGIFGNLLGRG